MTADERRALGIVEDANRPMSGDGAIEGLGDPKERQDRESES